MLYFVVIQITFIFCTDYIDKLHFLAFYSQSFYCTYSNVTSLVVINSPPLSVSPLLRRAPCVEGLRGETKSGEDEKLTSP